MSHCFFSWLSFSHFLGPSVRFCATLSTTCKMCPRLRRCSISHPWVLKGKHFSREHCVKRGGSKILTLKWRKIWKNLRLRGLAFCITQTKYVGNSFELVSEFQRECMANSIGKCRNFCYRWTNSTRSLISFFNLERFTVIQRQFARVNVNWPTAVAGEARQSAKCQLQTAT